VFGIFTSGRWSGPLVDRTDEDSIAVYQCDSELEMRLALQQAPESASAVVLVTPVDEGKISADIMVRLALRKLHPLNSWEIVRSLFGAKQLDPRITQHVHLADTLLECTAGIDVPPVAAGFLDAETAWRILLSKKLGLPGAEVDGVDLLKSSAETDLAARWSRSSAEFRTAAAEWISSFAGDLAGAILASVQGDHGTKALSLGLVMGVVFHCDVGHELDKAAGRLESYLGATELSPGLARRWGDAAARAAKLLSDKTLRCCHDEAETILRAIGADEHAWRSDVLPLGLEQRLSQMGRVIVAALESGEAVQPAEPDELLHTIYRHRLGRGRGRRLERVEMALRLVRWVSSRRSEDSAKTPGLVDAARSYVGEGCFVDWARQVLRGGEANPELAAAYARLVECTAETRERENRRFGQALVEHRAAGNPELGLAPVERILDLLVGRLAKTLPVLVLVMDGMSWTVLRELLADIKSRNWVELSADRSLKRVTALAALPSVTETCRASLLCGTLCRGKAPDEVKGFAGHHSLLVSSQSGLPPKLFHKAAIEAEDDSGLAVEIREAIGNKRQRVVGIVLNAVDDHLDKGDQVDAIWTVEHVRALEPILAECRDADRLIVLLSDHGHVVERHTEQLDGSDGTRWRRPEKPIREEEVLVDSPRVLMPDGGRVVLPWTERVRYGAKRNGYHGGATPQEMLIPVALLWPRLQLPDGLAEIPPDYPSWWTCSPVVELPVRQQKPKPSRKSGAPLLFEATTTARPAKSTERWLEELLKNDLFVKRKVSLVGKQVLENSTTRLVLWSIARCGGSIATQELARMVDQPGLRLERILDVLQDVLNVEGFAILTLGRAEGTVALDVRLLKEQFDLGAD